MVGRIVVPIVTVALLSSGIFVSVWADRGQRDRDKDRDRSLRIEKSERGDRGRRGGNREHQPKVYEKRKGYVLDKSYRHNRYYPPRGHVTRSLPRDHRIISHRGKRYYHHSGAWYFYSGTRYVVVRPPIGISVSLLPAYYTTIWVGGVPYYYANDVYYIWRPQERVYVVTNPPPQSEIREQPAEPDKMFVYPKRGQSEQQQATDRYQCYQWSLEQTGFDPTRSGGNVPEAEYSSKRSDYHRAMKACLEARGYSVQ